ncbi:unnamed protein product [Bursaphelenchus xylophilus]|uniref:(pine wood nematode) hypothetical protein n=1 Tax=Bursaphelenchus xylophilus TaxID=6326 RepID=A0A1I7SUD4_BURXY|nr:unnamed protein product [Bursaphelenchus xylophilus]CAG9107263.1 unnamed protein product [Bursaphelenchus xylophilus]
MSGNLHNDYLLLDGRLHVVNASYGVLVVNLVVSLFSVPFFPGAMKAVPVVLIPLAHIIIALGIYKKISHIVHAAMGLFIVSYLGGLITSIILLFMEVSAPRRGSYKLYLLHVSTLSAVLTNTLIILLYLLRKVSNYIREDYNTLRSEPI